MSDVCTTANRSIAPSSSSALFFTPELPLRTVNCYRHEDAPMDGESERASERNANQRTPRRAAPRDATVAVEMISRIWQRLRCSFHRRFAERNHRLLLPARARPRTALTFRKRGQLQQRGPRDSTNPNMTR